MFEQALQQAVAVMRQGCTYYHPPLVLMMVKV
jgi:hypothetical protein